MTIKGNEIVVLADQQPGLVSFYNYEEIKAALEQGLAPYRSATYLPSQIKDAKNDLKQLKEVKKKLSDKKKELAEAYSKPFQDIESKLNELIAMIDEPLKTIDSLIKAQEAAEKEREITEYAQKQAAVLGEYADSILTSPAFRNPRWALVSMRTKQCHDEIDEKIAQAAKDIDAIRATGSEHTPVLMARYIETLSMAGTKEFLQHIEQQKNVTAQVDVRSEDFVKGYKILKITGTEDQMASLLTQMDIMGVEVEEIENGMPRAMEELLEPSFDSFVAFDIETTGSFGAANGDGEAVITEIGAVRVAGGKVVEKFDELANPGRKIVPRIARLTHITDQMVADKPPIDEIMRRFADFCGGSILVGHNIKSSDLHYIGKAAKKAGISMENRFLDTYLLAKRFKAEKGWEKLNLGYLAEQYGFTHVEVHRAWSDAHVNADIYFELKKLSETKLSESLCSY